MTASQLLALSLAPAMRFLRRWWIQRIENHYLICANSEAQREREARQNVAYYQRRAAMARSELSRI